MQQTSRPLTGSTPDRIPWILYALAACLFAGPATAADGVIEINQAKAIAGGVTLTDTPGFPVTIDTGGSYMLTSNLEPPGPAAANAVEIDTLGVSLDLNGFTIAGSNTCTDTLTVPNVVTCTGGGFTLHGIAGTSTGGVRIHNGFIGRTLGSMIHLTGARGVELKDLFMGQSGDATGCVQLGDGNTLVRVRVGLCNGGGIVAGGGTKLTTCSTGASNLAGMSIGAASSVIDSQASLNGQVGILCTGGCVLTSNVTTSNGTDGISSALLDSSVNGNVSSLNGGVGAALSAGSTFGENVFQLNTTGPVTGGVTRGTNTCNGAAC